MPPRLVLLWSWSCPERSRRERREGSAVGVMEPALSAVEGSAARCLRSGRVCGASDPLFPYLECGGGLRAMGARRETRRRFPASTMSSRAQRVVCAPDVFAERGICCFPLGVRRRAPGHRCPARNSTPLSRLYDVIPSAARDLLLVSWSLPRPCRGASAFSSPVVILRGRSPEESTPRPLPITPSIVAPGFSLP